MTVSFEYCAFDCFIWILCFGMFWLNTILILILSIYLNTVFWIVLVEYCVFGCFIWILCSGMFYWNIVYLVFLFEYCVLDCFIWIVFRWYTHQISCMRFSTASCYHCTDGISVLEFVVGAIWFLLLFSLWYNRHDWLVVINQISIYRSVYLLVRMFSSSSFALIQSSRLTGR